MDNMNLIVDTTIYQQQAHGGIPRIFTEILPRLCDLEPALRIALLTTGRCKQPLPHHAQIALRRLFPIDDLLRPGRWWRAARPWARSMVHELALRRVGRAIWHSTYYTLPRTWQGPVVVTVFDMMHESLRQWYKGVGSERLRQHKRACALRADAIVCISQTTRAELLRHYAPDPARVYVTPLACSTVFRPLPAVHSQPHPLNGRPFLLYVGGRWGYKNWTGFLEAYRAWSRHREVDVIALGTPFAPSEQAQLRALGVAEHIHLLQQVDDRALCLLYNQAAALIYPSCYEGFGIPLLEAMACGCPIVASRIPSSLEVAGDCPIYFDLADRDSLVSALELAVLAGRDAARHAQGLARVRQYSWDRTAEQTLAVYRALWS